MKKLLIVLVAIVFILLSLAESELHPDANTEVCWDARLGMEPCGN